MYSSVGVSYTFHIYVTLCQARTTAGSTLGYGKTGWFPCTIDTLVCQTGILILLIGSTMIKIDFEQYLIYLIGDWVIFGLHVRLKICGGPTSDTPDVAWVERHLRWSWFDKYHADGNFLRFYFDTRQARWRSKSISWVSRCEDFGCNK